jgi:hypothetical protein
MMKFNAALDVDPIILRARSLEESKQIHSTESTRRGRTLEEIMVSSMYGLAAEVYLLQEGYIDDNRPYKDLFEPVSMGSSAIEVKVTSGTYYVPYVIKRAEKCASESWRDYPKKLYVFIGDKETLNYYLEGIYNFDGLHFVKDVV